jgi:glycosyltransferase involved in cell wall biosynthesis
LPPLVSIIIPCFNGARYISGLAQSLAPVLAPDAGRYEVIFVDDGSQDESHQLAQKLLPYATIVRQENRGLSAARNAGVALARGECLQLLDVDDTIEPQKLEIQTGAAASAAADVVYSDWRLRTIDGSKIVRTEVFAPAQAPCEMVEALLAGWWVPPVCYLFRRSAYVELGGCDESIRVWEDFDLFLRFALVGRRHVYAPGILSTYYRYLDVQSLARRDPRANAMALESILRRIVATLSEQGKLTPPRRKAAAKALFSVLRTTGISDPAWLQNMAKFIHDLDPSFRPGGSAPYRALARTLGLATTERLAIALRGFREQGAGKSR